MFDPISPRSIFYFPRTRKKLWIGEKKRLLDSPLPEPLNWTHHGIALGYATIASASISFDPGVRGMLIANVVADTFSSFCPTNIFRAFRLRWFIHAFWTRAFRRNPCLANLAAFHPICFCTKPPRSGQILSNMFRTGMFWREFGGWSLGRNLNFYNITSSPESWRGLINVIVQGRSVPFFGGNRIQIYNQTSARQVAIVGVCWLARSLRTARSHVPIHIKMRYAQH